MQTEHPPVQNGASDNYPPARSTNKEKNKGKRNSLPQIHALTSSPSAQRNEKGRRKQVNLKLKRQGKVEETPSTVVYTPERLPDTFWAILTVQDRQQAIEYATAAYERSSREDLIFFADGSVRRGIEASGAGVVYTCAPGNESAWNDYGYCVTDLSEILQLELFGIGAALKLAVDIMQGTISPMGHSPSRTPSPSPSSGSSSSVSSSSLSSTSLTTDVKTVTILTDSQSSIELLGQWPYGKASLQDRVTTDLVKRLITLSQRLISLDANLCLEIRWVPGHMAKTPWNKRADLMAKSASNLVIGTQARSRITNLNGTVVVADSSFLQCP